MLLSVLCFPFISAFFIFICGRYTGNVGSAVISLFGSFLTVLFALALNVEVFIFGVASHIEFFDFVNLPPIHMFFSVVLNEMSAVMLFVVALISFFVQLYSFSYMYYDPHLARFMAYLSLFTFCMFLLIFSENFLQLFFGWEGVGLCSYLLISFWFTRTQANTSSLKAFVVNRVGDAFFVLGMALTTSIFFTVSFIEIEGLLPLFNKIDFDFWIFQFDLISVIAFMFFCGAMSKSAQIFLHTWLPDAMEGPTPVSALIHAATMVAAGVFLLIKCHFIFSLAPAISVLITFIGALTALFASLVGFFQNDIKKIIAYSTCSQLGYMFVAVGLTCYPLAFFHLFNHAFFKALLFLASGSIIHSVSDNQDIRRLGGLLLILPITYIAFVCGSLALVGFPYFSGWYSKDIIIEVAYFFSPHFLNFTFFAILAAAFFTSAYSLRLVYLVFFSKFRFAKTLFFSIVQEEVLMSLIFLVLIFFSMFIGSLLNDWFLFSFFSKFDTDISDSASFNFIDAEFLPYFVKLIPFLLFFLACYFAFILNFILFKQVFWFLSKTKNFYIFLVKKWYFDVFCSFFFAHKAHRNTFDSFITALEKGFFEVWVPELIVKTVSLASKYCSFIQTGLIYNYLVIFVSSIISLIIICLVSWKLKFAVAIVCIMGILMYIYKADIDFKVIRHLTPETHPGVYGAFWWAPPLMLIYFYYTLLIYGYYYLPKYKQTPFLEWFI